MTADERREFRQKLETTIQNALADLEKLRRECRHVPVVNQAAHTIECRDCGKLLDNERVGL